MRRLFTYVVFQSSCFDEKDVAELRDTLAQNGRIYFQHFGSGVDKLSNSSIAKMVGVEFATLDKTVQEVRRYRNKIFHGQLTREQLSATELAKLNKSVRKWCQLLSKGAQNALGYDGFERKSFRKGASNSLSNHVSQRISTLSDYKTFLEELTIQAAVE